MADLPVPVAPSSTTSCSPPRSRRSSSSMAVGWSPAGWYSLTTSNRPPWRGMSPTGRNSECATGTSGWAALPGISVANATRSRVRAPPDSFRGTGIRHGSIGPVHPPKTALFDLAAGVNVDTKGCARAVDEYRETPFGLYMSRAMVDRPTAHWVESWLLPELGLCVTDWWWNPGHAPGPGLLPGHLRDRAGRRPVAAHRPLPGHRGAQPARRRGGRRRRVRGRGGRRPAQPDDRGGGHAPHPPGAGRDRRARPRPGRLARRAGHHAELEAAPGSPADRAAIRPASSGPDDLRPSRRSRCRCPSSSSSSSSFVVVVLDFVVVVVVRRLRRRRGARRRLVVVDRRQRPAGGCAWSAPAASAARAPGRPPGPAAVAPPSWWERAWSWCWSAARS